MRGVRRRQLRVLGGLVVLLCLWTAVAQAITLNVTDDTFIKQDKPAETTGGTAPRLEVKNTGGADQRITYAIFDLLPLPGGAVVQRAVLRLFVDTVPTAGSFQICRMTASWNEGNLSWNSANIGTN